MVNTTGSDRQQAILRMLESASLTAGETDRFFAEAQDSDYWRGLNPSLHVESEEPVTCEASSLSAGRIDRELTRIGEEGYFRTGPFLDQAVIERMRNAVEVVRANRWPAVFAFVYDEFWQVVRGSSMKTFVGRFLGPGYRQNASFWTYYVPPSRGSAGWPPHADSHDTDSRLTVWIPLTDATVENGCMYVIPRDRMPDSLPADFSQFKTVTIPELQQLLQGTKALPASPGECIGWNHLAIHWGSVSSGATTPRISIAVEFIAAGCQPTSIEQPLQDPDTLPPFADRLRMIGACLKEYSRFEITAGRYRELAGRLAGLQAGI